MRFRATPSPIGRNNVINVQHAVAGPFLEPNYTESECLTPFPSVFYPTNTGTCPISCTNTAFKPYFQFSSAFCILFRFFALHCEGVPGERGPQPKAVSLGVHLDGFFSSWWE